jgi:hypothetical protein
MITHPFSQLTLAFVSLHSMIRKPVHMHILHVSEEDFLIPDQTYQGTPQFLDPAAHLSV